jgi:hypothetical protein
MARLTRMTRGLNIAVRNKSMFNRLRLYHSHLDEAAPREAKPHPVNPNDPHSWVVWEADDFKAGVASFTRLPIRSEAGPSDGPVHEAT